MKDLRCGGGFFMHSGMTREKVQRKVLANPQRL